MMHQVSCTMKKRDRWKQNTCFFIKAIIVNVTPKFSSFNPNFNEFLFITKNILKILFILNVLQY